MPKRKAVALALATLFCVCLFAAIEDGPKPWREFAATEYDKFPVPRDFEEKTEFVFARLMYPNTSLLSTRFGGFGRNWTQGGRGIYWTMDYPRSDRHFVQVLRRLTRIHTRSVEQPVNLDDGDQFYWPFLYAVEPGHWELTDAQIKAFREYLLRGGFFMCDDFHGTVEWEIFTVTMRKVFPDRPIVEIPDKDQIFHVVYDLNDRYQVPGMAAWERGLTYEQDGVKPAWRGIYDDKGRLMVAICHNMDLGDSWEHADDPEFPEKFSALGMRIGINYAVYAMTH